MAEYERLSAHSHPCYKVDTSNHVQNDITDDECITTIKGQIHDTNSDWRLIEAVEDSHHPNPILTADKVHQRLCSKYPVLCLCSYDSKVEITKYFPYIGIFQCVDNKWLLTGNVNGVTWLETIQNNIKHRYQRHTNVALQNDYGLTGMSLWRVNEIYYERCCIMALLVCITPGMKNHRGDTTIQPLVQLVVVP